MTFYKSLKKIILEKGEFRFLDIYFSPKQFNYLSVQCPLTIDTFYHYRKWHDNRKEYKAAW